MTAAAAAPASPAHVDATDPAAQLAAAAGAEKAAAAAAPDPKATPATPAAPAKPPEPKVETPKEPVGAAFARLARAEKARVAKEQAAKAEIEADRAKLAAERAEIDRLRKEAQGFRDAEAQAKEDPAAYLERTLGKDWYEKLTEMKLSGGKVPADLVARAIGDKLEGRLSAFEKKVEEDRKRDAEERQKAIEAEKARIAEERKAEIERFESETVEFVKAHTEEYELTNLYEQQELVPEVIREHFAQTKRILSPKEAAEIVERHFEEQIEKGTKSKRLAPKFTAAPKTETPPAPKAAPTLSNGTAPAPSFAAPAKTEEERLARALAAMTAKATRTSAA